MKIKINRPRISEANIQGEFYHYCRVLDIPCYLEYKHENSRFDAVICDPQRDEILIIVEIKNMIRKHNNWNTKQLIKYKKFNLPLILIDRSSSIKEGVVKILNILYKNNNEFCIKEKKLSVIDNKNFFEFENKLKKEYYDKT